MNLKTAIGLIVLLGFTLLLFLSFGNQVGGYMSFSEAGETGGQAHVVGTWVEDAPMSYDRRSNVFTFHMRDEEGTVRRIVYPNPKPPNFEEATQVVIQGKMGEGAFEAEHILVKCPSKYNGGPEFEAAEKSAPLSS